MFSYLRLDIILPCKILLKWDTFFRILSFFSLRYVANSLSGGRSPMLLKFPNKDANNFQGPWLIPTLICLPPFVLSFDVTSGVISSVFNFQSLTFYMCHASTSFYFYLYMFSFLKFAYLLVLDNALLRDHTST